MAYLGNLVLILLLTVSAFGQDLSAPHQTSGLPEPGKAVGVAISNTAGRWLVVRAAPFEIVTDLRTVVDSSQSYVIWQGTKGIYTAVLIPTIAEAPLEFATVTLGEVSPDPGPEPDPSPKPPPGKRQVMVIEEKDQRTPAIALVQQKLQDYCAEKGHEWVLIDDDTVDQQGRRPERLQFFLSEMQKSNINTPAIVVAVQWQGKEHFGLRPLPSNVDQAIKIVQEYGG